MRQNTVDGRNPVNSPVDGKVVYTHIYKVFVDFQGGC